MGRLRRVVSQIVLAGWGVACVVVSAYLLAAHLLTLPTPDAADVAVRTAIAQSRSARERDRWLAVHVLSADCKCSRRVLDHLLSSDRPRDVAERIVWITADASGDVAELAAMRAHDFAVDVVAPGALRARYHLESAPLLVIAAPDGRVGYLGGYTTTKQAADVEDLVVLAAVRRGDRVAALPAFGCAVGQHLTAQVDPLGIRGWL